MKAALIALALLMASPAVADTIIIDLNPWVLQTTYPEFYATLYNDGFYGDFPGIACPTGCTIRVALDFNSFINDHFGLGNGGSVRFINSIPEPATWALLLFGFAFFAVKNIWPNSPENDH